MNQPPTQESILNPATIPVHGSGAWWFRALMGVALMIMGGAFAFFLWWSFHRAEETRSWTPVACTIVTSQLNTLHVTPDSPTTYKAEIRYRYNFEGVIHTGTLIRRVNGATADKPKAELAVKTYPVGASKICYVNPADPKVAILEQGTIAAIYAIWFPILFVVGGAGMVVSAFRSLRQ
jgi:hypothetical protein